MYGRYCGFFTPFFHFFRIFRKSRKSALQRLCRALFSLFFKIFKISAKFSKKSEKKCSAELCRGFAEHFFHFFSKIFENFQKFFTKLHKVVYAKTKTDAHSSCQCQQQRRAHVTTRAQWWSARSRDYPKHQPTCHNVTDHNVSTYRRQKVSSMMRTGRRRVENMLKCYWVREDIRCNKNSEQT